MKAVTQRQKQIAEFSVKKTKVSPQFPVQLHVMEEGKARRRTEETTHPP